MHSTTLYYTLTLLLATTTTLSAPISQPQIITSSSSPSTSIFTSHFHSLLSARDSPHAKLIEASRREIQESSNLLPRSASPDPNASNLYPSHHHEEEYSESSSSPVPSRSLDATFRSPRLDGRQGKVSKGGWLSWVATAPRSVRGLSGAKAGRGGEEKRWRAWEGVDHSI